MSENNLLIIQDSNEFIQAIKSEEYSEYEKEYF